MIHLFKKYKQLLAYIVLVAFVIFAFANQQSDNSAQTNRLKVDTQYVLVKSCERGNTLRTSLDHVVLGFTSEIPTKAQQAIIAQFSQVNCNSASNLNQNQNQKKTKKK